MAVAQRRSPSAPKSAPRPARASRAAPRAAKAKTLRIPKQFKPERKLGEGPFGPWVENVMKFHPQYTPERLVPTQADLELVAQLAYQRDELGDRLAAKLLTDRRVARQFEQGLVQGVASLDDPAPELVDFLNYYENMPDWAYMNELKAFLAESHSTKTGSAARKALPEFALDGLAMATGFFVGANYPAVGQALVATGSVRAGTTRMTQTMNFVEDMTDIRGFLPHGRAVQCCAKVRLAHAFARREIEKSGKWDKDYYGEIISEFDNMMFMSGLTLVPDLPAYARLSPRSMQAMKLQTKAIQYLLGAPRELVAMPFEENQRFFVMVVAHLDDSPATAREVVKAFRANKYFRPDDTLWGKISRELAFLSANMMIRVGWGNAMADSIGLERKFYGVDLPLLATLAAKEPPEVFSRLTPKALDAGERVGKVVTASVRRNPLLRAAVRRVMPPPQHGGASDALMYKGSYGAF